MIYLFHLVKRKICQECQDIRKIFLIALRMGTYLLPKGVSCRPGTGLETRELQGTGTSLHSLLAFSDKRPGKAVNLDLALIPYTLFPVVGQMPVRIVGRLF